MKLVFAPDSYKGSLSGEQICRLLTLAAREVWPKCETISLPVSDGGEGALGVVLQAMGGSCRRLSVADPMGRQIQASYGIYQENCAMIEMAAASGLPLVEPEQRDIRKASTYGTGQLILDALEQGCRRLTIAIGGSATNDGGLGCMAALGARFLDEAGRELEPVPEFLGRIERIDLEGFHPLAREAKFTVICDVTNPLLGTEGAALVFGPQKGASREDQEFLEKGMAQYAKVLERTFGRDFAKDPGAGAAGGLGAGLMAFLGAQLKPGIETILDILEFDRVLEGADLVVTGEGRTDSQSVRGKVLSGVGMAAKRRQIPCIAIVGGLGEGAMEICRYGVDSLMTTINGPMTIEAAMANAEELFLNAARRMFALLQVGQRMKAEADLGVGKIETEQSGAE